MILFCNSSCGVTTFASVGSEGSRSFIVEEIRSRKSLRSCIFWGTSTTGFPSGLTPASNCLVNSLILLLNEVSKFLNL